MPLNGIQFQKRRGALCLRRTQSRKPATSRGPKTSLLLALQEPSRQYPIHLVLDPSTAQNWPTLTLPRKRSMHATGDAASFTSAILPEAHLRARKKTNPGAPRATYIVRRLTERETISHSQCIRKDQLITSMLSQ